MTRPLITRSSLRSWERGAKEVTFSDIEPEHPVVAAERTHCRHRWLLNLSLFLAIALQCLPVESDIVFAIHLADGTKSACVFRILCLKVAVLTAIFGPLAVFLRCNKWQVKQILYSIQGIATCAISGLGILLTAVVIVRVVMR